MQQLAAKFVPAAEDVEPLHNSKGEDGRLYHQFADGGHYKGGGQGIYAATPSGVLLGSTQANPDPKVVAAMMEKALVKWKTLSRRQRLLAKEPDRELAERRLRGLNRGSSYPADGLVLHVFYRDLPRENIHPFFRHAWNQDHAWFKKAEARAFLPDKLEKGARHNVPRDLVERLVRLHLLDHVRAHTYDTVPKEGVEKARLTATVEGIKGNLVALRLEGESRASQKGWGTDEAVVRDEFRGLGREVPDPARRTRGYEPKLLGHATYDLEGQKFTSFELLAVGPRWGAGNCNLRIGGPHQIDVDPAPMGVLFALAGDGRAERMPPNFLSQYGWK